MATVDVDALISRIPTQVFVNGEWRDAAGGATFDVLNPATGQVLAQVADGTEADGAAALDAACAAQRAWAETPSRTRASLLAAAYDRVIELTDDFAALMTLEMGKPLDQARGEVVYGAEFLRWFSEVAAHISGDAYPTPEGAIHVITHQRPVGPCLFITPWNFPLAMSTRKIAPALAAGCTCVLKPSHDTPLTSLLFIDVLRQVGVPAGVVNVVPTASTRQVTGPLMADPRLRKVSFTGSTGVGSALLKQAADNVLRTSMELGGLAPFIVFADADLDLAVDAAMATKMRNMGEACNAADRFFIHSSLVDEFTRRFADKMAAQTVGDGLEDGVDVGPIISEKQLNSVADLVDRSVAAGSEVVTGGHRIDRDGFFFEPTVIRVSGPDDPLMHEEVFGPVAPVLAFDDEDQVLEWANDTPYGLAGYVYTNDAARIFRLVDRLEVGMIGLNSQTVSNAAAPFGGVKASGLGREGGHTGIDEFLETVYVGIPR
ncbi:MAG: NAD-dependent succinate-semialdehyde dehydrogenase [Actinomycetaceae bacterium]|nr:NAD-dependent succinate-semialdehyde dehydrogenase [Actinomycetaceae bacterium]MDU0970348.1 NAD-dependent succinate-semialdehyde dehydrogenase [Actinomycetaceae bacterium]